jgi:hypothetical protein
MKLFAATRSKRKMAGDVFDRFKFTCQDDKEARLFTLTDEPLATVKVNVGSTSRQAPLFLMRSRASKAQNSLLRSQGATQREPSAPWQGLKRSGATSAPS